MGTKRSKETCEKLRQIQLSAEHQRKISDTKRKNNSFNISKPEKEILKLLQSKFSNVKHQYKSEKYPFNCDFYIPDLDLYIEYQGHFTHNFKPFEGTSEDLEKIKLWKNKNTKLYGIAIKVWTVRDPLKRQIAKENNLNWIEFFNMKQFMDWFEKQK